MTRAILFLFILFFFACNKDVESVKKIDRYLFVSELQNSISSTPLFNKNESGTFNQFLNNGDYHFEILKPEGFSAIQIIKDRLDELDQHGLEAYFSPLKSLWLDQRIKNDSLLQLAIKENDIKALVNLELLTKKTAIEINRALEFGIVNPNAIYEADFYVKTEQPDSVWFFNQLSKEDLPNYVSSFSPINSRYSSLQKAYARMNFDALQKQWTSLKQLPGPKLEEGDSYLGANQLRKLLELPLQNENDETVNKYDVELVNAVKEFQASYGLKQDGIIGPSTFSLLNKSPDRIKSQIEASLERFRWKTNIDEEHLLLINIPEFELYIYEEGELKRKQKVGVGINNEKLRTPQFVDTLETIVVNPKWYLPRSIATLETLPKAQLDPYYLIANNYEMYQGNSLINPFDVDLKQFNPDNFPYRFVQGVGDNNSLGRVKFLFPNKYSIYLHDTPSKYVFNRDNRSVSHGCIRLQDPFKLADDLLGENKEYQEAKKNDENTTFLIDKPIYTVYITYFTTWVDNAGNLQFRDDVYEKDKILINKLKNITLSL